MKHRVTWILLEYCKATASTTNHKVQMSFQCTAAASTTIFTRSWILWHLPSWRPAQWRWLGLFSYVLLPQKKGWVLSEERPCFVSMAVDFDCEHLFFVSLFLVLQMFSFLRKSTFSNVIHDRFPLSRTGAMARWWTNLGFLEAIKHLPKSRRSWILGSEVTSFLKDSWVCWDKPFRKVWKRQLNFYSMLDLNVFFLLDLNDERTFILDLGALIRSWWKKCRLHLATSWLSDMGFTRWWNGGCENGSKWWVYWWRWSCLRFEMGFSRSNTSFFVGQVSILSRSFWEIYWFYGGWKILHAMNYMFIMDYSG